MAFGNKTVVGKPTFGKKPAGSPGTAAKAKYASTGKHISIKPSDQQQGGILDDADVQIKSMTFTTWDYQGQQEPGLALRVVYAQESGDETEQFYSAGKLERLVPSDDGRFADQAVGSNATGLSNSCNAAMFMTSLVEQGFPEDKIDEVDGSTEVFEGTVVHVNQQAQKKRAGLQGGDDGRTRTILLVTKILQLPWESEAAPAVSTKTVAKGKVAPPAKAAAGGKANGVAAPSGADALSDEAGAAVIQVLANNNGSVAKKVLGMQVFRVLGQSPNRSAILNLVASDEFLSQEGAPWSYDGTTVSAA